MNVDGNSAINVSVLCAVCLRIVLYTCGDSGYEVAQLVEVLRYKPEGRGFESFRFYIDLILPAALWPLGSTQSLTEMNARDLPWG